MTTQTRREFIRTFGAAVAALLGAGWLQGCAPTPTCYAPALPTPIAGGLAQRHPAWGRVRQYWLDLPARSPAELTGSEGGHRTALDGLVAAGEVDAAVADQLQLAYGEAAGYYRAAREIPPTCYEPTMVPPGCYVAPTPSTCYEAPALAQGRAALVRQLEALQEIAVGGGLDPATVTKARATIEQDIALFELVAALESRPIAEHRAEEDRIAGEFTSSGLTPPPEAVQAARILVDLLAGGEIP
jgi:hypothetical protein